MKTYIKILILIFICFTSTVLADEAMDTRICEAFIQNYELSDSYEVAVVSSRIEASLKDNTEISLRALTQKDPIGLFSVMVTIMENEKIVETSQVRLKIKKFENVFVATDRIKRHELISEVNSIIEKMDVSKLTSKAITLNDEFEGYRVKKNLRKGQIITMNDLEPIPDIESGMETTIVYDNGLCKITATGLALQAGVAGEYIKVKNTATNKIIIARIVDTKIVAIDP